MIWHTMFSLIFTHNVTQVKKFIKAGEDEDLSLKLETNILCVVGQERSGGQETRSQRVARAKHFR